MNRSTARGDGTIIALTDYRDTRPGEFAVRAATSSPGGRGRGYPRSSGGAGGNQPGHPDWLGWTEPEAHAPTTLVLSIYQREAEIPMYRIVGINDSLSLRKLFETLEVCFDFPRGGFWAVVGGKWRDTDFITPREYPISTLLSQEGDRADLSLRDEFGVYPFHLEVVECYVRDERTPDALCVGGDPYTDADAINAALTGEATTRQILESTRPEFQSLIERSGVFDFVPLLQALDLTRETSLDGPTMDLCRSLPLESDSAGRDAALVQILCQSTLGEEELRQEILSTTLGAIGWVADDGSELSIEEIDSLSASTLQALERLGLMGENRLSPVERLERCRAIIRAESGSGTAE